MDEIVLRLTVQGAKTGGQLPDVAHHAYFVKKLIESAVARGQLPNVEVTGYEMRNLDPMEPAKPKKPLAS